MDGTPAIIVLLVIAGAWAAFLLPPMFKTRRETPLASTEEFHRWRSRVASVQGRKGGRAAAKTQVVVRRRRVLLGLLLAAATTLMVAILQKSQLLLLLHISVDAVVAWYVAMLLQIRQRRLLEATVPPVTSAEGELVVEEEIGILASG